MKTKITYRGWPGHFILGNRCVFHLNTLIESGETRVVVSTVGNMVLDEKKKAEEIGLGRYYETMAFHASLQEGYWDANVSRGVAIRDDWSVSEINIRSDAKAQENHEAAVADIVCRIERGEIR